MTAPSFIPWDVEVAGINFGATCGPAAFAAVTELEVCRVMQFFPHFPERRWTNLTQMLRALDAAGYSARVQRRCRPSRGLALVQFTGPWTVKNFFSRWSLIHTHWVAIDGDWVFDHNACRWQPLLEWSAGTAAELMAELPRSTGWSFKYGVEVTKAVQFDLDLPLGCRAVDRSQPQALFRKP
jgi:hypothetical protein